MEKKMKPTYPILCLLISMIICLIGCAAKPQIQDAATGSPVPQASEPSLEPTATPNLNSFDISQAPIVNPQLGKFPYFSLIEGYQPEKDHHESKNVDFDRYEFFDGVKMISVEGRLTTIYAVNKDGKGPAAFKIMKTYESLVKKLGGVKVHEGKNYDRYSLGVEYNDSRHRPDHKIKSELGVYAVRLPDKEIWVEVFIPNYSDDDYYLTVVEKKNLDLKASLLTADEMKKAIDAQGRVALYINFDFNKADIKTESQPIIDEIVKLLKEDPSLNLSIEGHTDSIGNPASNKQLSDRRAMAVMSAVVEQGIEQKRLKSAGYGPDKPIAANSTEEGRAKNRRVELVKN